MKNEAEDWIAGLIFDNAPDVSELQRVDVELADPLAKFIEMRGAELFLSKSAAGVEQPSWDEILGAGDDTHDDSLEKRSSNFGKRSTSPNRLLQVIEVVDGEEVLVRYNHLGEIE